jgi:hypothetical protein
MADLLVDTFGAGAVSLMLVSYALEPRSRRFVALFAVGCALAAAYAWAVQSYPFLALEAVWAVVAWRRFAARSRRERQVA